MNNRDQNILEKLIQTKNFDVIESNGTYTWLLGKLYGDKRMNKRAEDLAEEYIADWDEWHSDPFKIDSKIEAKSGFKAGYQAASAWVKCSTQIPDTDQEVLTYGPTWGIQQATLSDDYWAACGGDNLLRIDEVTHWQPLPDPPVSQEGAEE